MLALTANEQSSLARAADKVIARCLKQGAGWIAKPPRGEVRAVASVVSGLPLVGPAWSAIFRAHGRRPTIAGVFTHDTPKVDYNPTRPNCELADLLVVVDDLATPQPERRAVLIQAKMLKNGAVKFNKTNDLVQLDLYMHWPPFEFAHGPYPRNRRDIAASPAPGNVADSGRYGIIDLAATTWEQLLPSTTMTPGTGQSLGDTLAEMIGGGGRPASMPGASAGDDWSDTIALLLQHAAKVPIPATWGAAQRGVVFWKGSDDGDGELFRTWPGSFGGGDDPPGDDEPEPGDGPGAVLHIVMHPVDRAPRER
jgi:hypothetical protein